MSSTCLMNANFGCTSNNLHFSNTTRINCKAIYLLRDSSVWKRNQRHRRDEAKANSKRNWFLNEHLNFVYTADGINNGSIDRWRGCIVHGSFLFSPGKTLNKWRERENEYMLMSCNNHFLFVCIFFAALLLLFQAQNRSDERTIFASTFDSIFVLGNAFVKKKFFVIPIVCDAVLTQPFRCSYWRVIKCSKNAFFFRFFLWNDTKMTTTFPSSFGNSHSCIYNGGRKAHNIFFSRKTIPK